MAIVIRNSAGYYIAHDENGKIKKVCDISEAKNFPSVSRAINLINGYPAKTKGYYVYDTCT